MPADGDIRAELRDAVRGIVDRLGGTDAARRVMETRDGYEADLWRRLTDEIGLAGIGIAEEHGGQGASFVEVALVAGELARSVLPVPFLAGAVLAAGATDDAEVLGRVAAGEPAALCWGDTAGMTGGTVTGRFDHVIDGAAAAFFVVAVGTDLVVVDAADARCEPVATLDQTRRQATVTLDGAPARPVTGDLARALDLGRVALAAEAAAGARRCVEMTVDYANVRVQFGRPIGSFQALKHRIADMYVEAETATSTAEHAAWTAAYDADKLPLVAAAAKAHCADAFAHVAQETIQLHGGIGFTWEHDAHLHLKRAWSTRQLLGEPRALRRTVADLAGV